MSIAPLVGMQSVLPVMRSGSGGAIVNVSSATSLRVFPGLGGYAATKAALNMLSQVGRLEFADAGVSVSVVYPSVTATEFHRDSGPATCAGGARRMTPHPPELVGQAIVFAIKTGEAHVLVADPPRPIVPGELGWSPSPVRDRECRPRPLRREHRAGTRLQWRAARANRGDPRNGGERAHRPQHRPLARPDPTARVRAFDIAPDVEELADEGAVETVVGDLLDPGDVRRAVRGARTIVHIGPPMHPREAEMGHIVVGEPRVGPASSMSSSSR